MAVEVLRMKRFLAEESTKGEKESIPLSTKKEQIGA